MKNNYELAQEVLAGKWGNGAERRERLTAGGYDYNAVQSIVNALVMDRQSAQAPAVNNVQDTGNYLVVECDITKYAGIELHIKGVN